MSFYGYGPVEGRAEQVAVEEAHARMQVENQERAAKLGALTAAMRRAGHTPTFQLVTWLKRFVEDSLGIEVHVIEPGTKSAELVGEDNALAVRAGRKRLGVVIQPIVDEYTLATTYHELGHHRDWSGVKLQGEWRAWRWAREHCPVWGDVAQERMVSSIKTYLADAKLPDVLDVLEVERLISPNEYRAEKSRRVLLDLARPQSERDALAREARQWELEDEARVDAQIAEQKRWREQMRGKATV